MLSQRQAPERDLRRKWAARLDLIEALGDLVKEDQIDYIGNAPT